MTPQKITVKIPRKQGELIPFDLDKWNTGEYEAVNKYIGIGRLLCTDNGGNYPIIVVYRGGQIGSYTIDGRHTVSDKEPRLFLRKKSSEELPSDDYLNADYRGVTGVCKSITDAEHQALKTRLAIIHITYQWEDEK